MMKHSIRRWSVVVLLTGLAFLLGFVGFSKMFAAAGEPHNDGDALYLAIQLFFLESGFVESPINTELQIARFLAPVAAAYAFVQTVVVTVLTTDSASLAAIAGRARDREWAGTEGCAAGRAVAT